MSFYYDNVRAARGESSGFTDGEGKVFKRDFFIWYRFRCWVQIMNFYFSSLQFNTFNIVRHIFSGTGIPQPYGPHAIDQLHTDRLTRRVLVNNLA